MGLLLLWAPLVTIVRSTQKKKEEKNASASRDQTGLKNLVLGKVRKVRDVGVAGKVSQVGIFKLGLKKKKKKAVQL